MKKLTLIGRLALIAGFSTIVQAETIYFNNHSLVENNTVRKEWVNNSLQVKFHLKKMDVGVQKLAPYKDDFQKLKVKGLETSKKVGYPALPYYSVLVEGRPGDFNLKVDEGEAHQFNYLPSPAQQKPCRCAKKDETETFVMNDRVYEEGVEKVEVKYLGDVNGRHVSKVIVRPASFDFENALQVFPNMKVEIEGAIELDSLETLSNDKYLVLYADSLASGASEFVDYKRSQGFEVESYALSSIGKSADDVKRFVQDKYAEEAFGYSVFVGHEDLFPSHYVQTSSSTVTPSDYPNFLMGGEGDKIPDVYYGRIVAQTNSEVVNQVKKMKEYTNKSWSNASGSKTHIGIASNEGWDPSDEEYVQSMINPLVRDLGHEAIYFMQAAGDSTVANINQRLNDGAIFLNYIGHGIGDSWPNISTGEYHSRDIKNLRPGAVKPIIVDVACQNGRFNYSNRLGERFMNETKNGNPIGAVAYYGGSVDISWDPPAIMAIAINESIAKNEGKSLGQVIMEGQMHLIETYDDPEAALENLRWYHLFGDPSLEAPSY